MRFGPGASDERSGILVGYWSDARTARHHCDLMSLQCVLICLADDYVSQLEIAFIIYFFLLVDTYVHISFSSHLGRSLSDEATSNSQAEFDLHNQKMLKEVGEQLVLGQKRQRSHGLSSITITS